MPKYGHAKKFCWYFFGWDLKISLPSKIVKILVKKISMPTFWHTHILAANQASPVCV
jgi:hypothetical protein